MGLLDREIKKTKKRDIIIQSAGWVLVVVGVILLLQGNVNWGTLISGSGVIIVAVLKYMSKQVVKR